MRNKAAKQDKLFSFRQFSLSDSRCAMKIGTDGVLLGSFSANFPSSYVLDIGTGCGLVALMIAQKSNAQIHAVEIDPDASLQAGENFRNSPWQNRFQVFNVALQEFMPSGGVLYDLIVCNPPYFQNSLKSTSHLRNLARHNRSLTFDELFDKSSQLLSPHGKLIIIYPADNDEEMIETARKYNLFLSGRLLVKPSPAHQPKRIISIFETTEPKEVRESILCIESMGRHKYSEEYKNLMSEYHPFL